jgi:hypothetical protein
MNVTINIMNLQFFVCFHVKIFHEIYKITSIENEQYLTFNILWCQK